MHPESAANAAEFFDNDVPIAPVGEVSSTDDTEWDALVSAAVERVNRVERLNAESDQRGRSWSLPVDPSEQLRRQHGPGALPGSDRSAKC